MAFAHAVVWIDHHHALIQHFSAADVQVTKIKDHVHNTHQRGSGVRAIHEFYADVCDALQGIPEILVTGSRLAQADFKHYVEKHRAKLAPHILGWETVEHLSDAQLLALGRKFFDKVDRHPPPKPSAEA